MSDGSQGLATIVYLSIQADINSIYLICAHAPTLPSEKKREDRSVLFLGNFKAWSIVPITEQLSHGLDGWRWSPIMAHLHYIGTVNENGYVYTPTTRILHNKHVYCKNTLTWQRHQVSWCRPRSCLWVGTWLTLPSSEKAMQTMWNKHE